MGLFKPDMYRSLGFGFVLGTMLMVGAMWAQSDAGLSGQMIPQAQAQTQVQTLPDRTR